MRKNQPDTLKLRSLFGRCWLEYHQGTNYIWWGKKWVPSEIKANLPLPNFIL